MNTSIDSKQIPLAILLTIAIQTVSVIWWAASISHKVERQHMQIEDLQEKLSAQKQRVAIMSETVARLDERVSQQAAIIREMRDLMRR